MSKLLDRIRFWDSMLEAKSKSSLEDEILVTNRRNFLGLIAGAAAFVTVQKLEAIEAILEEPTVLQPVAAAEGNLEILRHGVFQPIGYVRSFQLPLNNTAIMVDTICGDRMPRYRHLSSFDIDLLAKYEGYNICHQIMEEILDPRRGNFHAPYAQLRIRMFGIEYSIDQAILSGVDFTMDHSNNEFFDMRLKLFDPQVSISTVAA